MSLAVLPFLSKECERKEILMKTRAAAQCKLCEKIRPLMESHLLPRALYEHLRYGWSGERSHQVPIRITEKSVSRPPRQVKKMLLCRDCEGRLNSSGEKWILKHGFKNPGTFDLQRMLREQQDAKKLSTGRIIYTAGTRIEWSKIAYFALSVFWRAAADKWPTDAGDVFIDMDATLSEGLRRYLLDQAEPPLDILLLVKVAERQTSWAQSMQFPSTGELEADPLKSGGKKVRSLEFGIPGMRFVLLHGPELPDDWRREGCLIRGEKHPIFLMFDDHEFSRMSLRLLGTAQPTKAFFQEATKKG